MVINGANALASTMAMAAPLEGSEVEGGEEEEWDKERKFIEEIRGREGIGEGRGREKGGRKLSRLSCVACSIYKGLCDSAANACGHIS